MSIFIFGVIDMKNKYIVTDDYVVIYMRHLGKTLECHIDLEDLAKVQITGTWCGLSAGNKIYARGRNKGKEIQMHKLLLLTDGNNVVDHRDGNGLNNTSSNLRVATRADNVRNVRSARSDSKTGIRGVQYLPKNNNYVAKIQIGSERVRLGIFADKYEAGRAYTKACLQHFGIYSVVRTPIKL